MLRKVFKLQKVLREGVAHCGSSPEKIWIWGWIFREATARIPTPKVFWMSTDWQKLFGGKPKKIKNTKFAA